MNNTNQAGATSILSIFLAGITWSDVETGLRILAAIGAILSAGFACYYYYFAAIEKKRKL